MIKNIKSTGKKPKNPVFFFIFAEILTFVIKK